MGAWLLVAIFTVNIMELGEQEWRNTILLQYSIKLPYQPQHCNVCVIGLLISYALECKKEGLVLSPHNELRDVVADLVIKFLIIIDGNCLLSITTK